MKLAAALVLSLVLGCASPDALWAAVDSAMPTVAAQAGAAAGPLRSAVERRETKFLLAYWAQAFPAARASIDARLAAGEISPDVADSMRETLAQFGAALLELQ